MKIVLLKYSPLHRRSELAPHPVDKWTQRSSLSLKELTSPCLLSTLGSEIAIWVFFFQDPAITLFQSYPSKVMKMGKKSQLRDTTDTVLKIRRGIKFKFHLGKRKAKFFKTIKSHLLELEIPLITHIYSSFKAVTCLVFVHGLCWGKNLWWDRHSP